MYQPLEPGAAGPAVGVSGRGVQTLLVVGIWATSSPSWLLVSGMGRPTQRWAPTAQSSWCPVAGEGPGPEPEPGQAWQLQTPDLALPSSAA